jgi:hypothetical protein
MRFLPSLLLVFLFQSMGFAATPSCFDLFTQESNNDLPPEIQALALLEQTGNYREYREQVGLQYVPVLYLKPEQVRVNMRIDIEEGIKDFFFLPDGQILWPIRHGKSQHSKDIAFDDAIPDGTITGQYSASRSMFFANEGEAFTIKLPSTEHGDLKTNLVKSVIISRLRSDAIAQVDARIGKDPELITLLDVLSMADVDTGNGFVVRSLAPLQDGNVTVPGFASYEALARAAEVLGKPYGEVRDEHFSKLFGRSLAKMLIRYGLIMDFPHDQNYLTRYAPDGRPLDQMVWRDLSDTRHLLWMYEDLGLSEFKAKTLENGFKYADRLETFYATNGMWGQFDVTHLGRMYYVVQENFIGHAYELLGQKTPPGADILDLEQFLKSPEGHAALRRFHRLPPDLSTH